MGIFWFNFSHTLPAGQIKICVGLKQHSQTRVVLLPCPAVNVDYCTHGDVYNWNLTGAGREYDPFGAMMRCCFHARLASTRSWT